jgi:hypothetical protein
MPADLKEHHDIIVNAIVVVDVTVLIKLWDE